MTLPSARSKIPSVGVVNLRHGRGHNGQGFNFISNSWPTAATIRPQDVITLGVTPEVKHRQYVDAGIGERIIKATVLVPYSKTIVQTANRRRWFGSQKPTQARSEVTKLPISYRDFMGEASESADSTVALSYSVLSRSNELRQIYKTEDNRPGNWLNVGCILPETEADEIIEDFIKLPKRVREYATFVLRECLSISEAEASTPPYDLFPAGVNMVQIATETKQSPTEGIVLSI